MPAFPRQVILYGNCQAAAVARFLRGIPELAAVFQLDWWQENTLHLAFANTDVRARLPSCDLLWAQLGTWQTGAAQAPVPPGCQVVFFPPLSLQCLWPLNAADSAMRPEPPDFPYGRFPYGDRLAISLMGQFGDLDEVVARYLATDITPGLSRFGDITRARQDMLDGQCQTDFSRFIYDQFRQRLLFRTIKHPGDLLMRKVVAFLIGATGGTWNALPASPGQERYHASMPGFGGVEFHVASGYWDLDPTINMPIHPQVIRHFGLQWVAEDTVYQHYNDHVTFEEYVRLYVTYRRRLQARA
jgi:hypothetical protein